MKIFFLTFFNQSFVSNFNAGNVVYFGLLLSPM